MKLILQAIKALFRKVENAIEDVRKSIPEVAQANWSQNDETKPDYVKNRTHYEEVKQESIVGLEFGVYGDKNFPIPFEIGQTWDLYYSANTNPSTATYSRYQDYTNDGQPLSVKQADDGTLYIGDPNVNSNPFYVTETEFKGHESWLRMYGISLVKVVCVSGTKTVTKVKTLDEKYVPDGAKPFKVTLSNTGNSSDRTYSEIKAAHDAGRFVYAETGNGQRYPFRSFGMYNSKNAAFFTINSVTVGNPNFITVWDVAVTDEGCTRTLQMLNALKNPNAITFTGAVEATYDGSEAVSVEIPQGGGSLTRIGMASTDTAVTIEPNKLYVFPEMASLAITLGGTIDTSIVQEYRFRFTSGATATTLTLPVDVIGDLSVEANKVYEVSILDGYLVSQSWEVV